MTYVFYETGDDDFFLHIAKTFSSNFTKYVESYIYKEVIASGDGMLPENLREALKKVLVKHMNVLTPLNCFLFPNVHVKCKKNMQCKGDHKNKDTHRAVLASDQWLVIEDSIAGSKTSLTSDKINIKDSKARNSLQRVFESFKIIRNDKNYEYVEHIEIASKAHPDEYKKNNLAFYMASYMEKANDIGNRAETKSFVYVRAKNADSHYNQFLSNVKPPNVTVTPCDEF